MGCVIVTGSGGLIGAEAVLHFAAQGLEVHGIDNDMRKYFFGANASTSWRIADLKQRCKRYHHHSIDIRDADAIMRLFEELGGEIHSVVHAAAQPSHDWAGERALYRFFGERYRHPQLAGSNAQVCTRCCVCLHVHQQGLWRPAKFTAPG